MQQYLLVGAGGTSTQFIGPALAYLDSYHRNRNEEWRMIIADGDTFEAKNLSRQLFDPSFIGINKAEAVCDMYARYPVESFPHYIGKNDLIDLVDNGMIILIGADNVSVRALIEERALQLRNVVVINGGNEYHDGSVQLWVREDGENKTPRLTYLHPEIRYVSDDDRSAMTCAQIASLPGGEQLIIANMAVAQHMLTALWRYHTEAWREGWTELQFDLMLGQVEHMNMRERKNWHLDENALLVR